MSSDTGNVPSWVDAPPTLVAKYYNMPWDGDQSYKMDKQDSMNEVFTHPDLLRHVLEKEVRGGWNDPKLPIKNELIQRKLELRSRLWKMASEYPMGVTRFLDTERFDVYNHYRPPKRFYDLKTPLFPEVLPHYEMYPGAGNKKKDVPARQNFVWYHFGTCNEALYAKMNRDDYLNFIRWIGGFTPHQITTLIYSNFSSLSDANFSSLSDEMINQAYPQTRHVLKLLKQIEDLELEAKKPTPISLRPQVPGVCTRWQDAVVEIKSSPETSQYSV